MYFCFYIIIFRWKRAWSFILTNLTSLYLWVLYAKIGWNCYTSSGKDFLLNVVKVFFTIHTYIPLIQNVALHLNKIKSYSPKNALCYVLLKLAQWFRRRRLYNFINSSLFLYHIPLEKSKTLYLNSVYPRINCTKFLILAWWFWRYRF